MTNRHMERYEPEWRPTRPRSPSEILEPARAPGRPAGARPRHSEAGLIRSVIRAVSAVMTALFVGMAALGGGGLLLHHAFGRPGPLEVSRTLTIPKGAGTREIAERLESEGIISNSWLFFISYHLMRNVSGGGRGQDLKAGEYEFKKNASMREVMDILVEGRSILEKITLPEGLTSKQIVEILRASSNLSGGIAEIPPEGVLLPETYKFSKNTQRQDLLDRMRVKQQRLMAEIWEKRQPGLPIETPEQAIILASIVEKETGRADERERVAAVFVNRLRKGMRLQSDPTIIYGIAPGEGSLGREITRADIEQKTAYNTYQIDGLPPGPICNPGRAAIEAVLNPAQTNDLYFVANGEGGHTFSATYKEHSAAVATWRRIERDQRSNAKEAAPAAAAPAAPAAAAGPGKAAAVPPSSRKQKVQAGSRTPVAEERKSP